MKNFSLTSHFDEKLQLN